MTMIASARKLTSRPDHRQEVDATERWLRALALALLGRHIVDAAATHEDRQAHREGAQPDHKGKRGQSDLPTVDREHPALNRLVAFGEREKQVGQKLGRPGSRATENPEPQEPVGWQPLAHSDGLSWVRTTKIASPQTTYQ